MWTEISGSRKLASPDSLESLISQVKGQGRALLAFYWFLQIVVLGIFFLLGLTKMAGAIVVPDRLTKVGWGGPCVCNLSGVVELGGAALLLRSGTWWVGWAALMTDAVATVILRLLVIHVDALRSMQIVAALALLACLPRPETVRTWLNRASGSGVGL